MRGRTIDVLRYFPYTYAIKLRDIPPFNLNHIAPVGNLVLKVGNWTIQWSRVLLTKYAKVSLIAEISLIHTAWSMSWTLTVPKQFRIQLILTWHTSYLPYSSKSATLSWLMSTYWRLDSCHGDDTKCCLGHAIWWRPLASTAGAALYVARLLRNIAC